jgi:hypothetical protein
MPELSGPARQCTKDESKKFGPLSTCDQQKLQPSIHDAGHKAWVFMATIRRVLAHTMPWNGQRRHYYEELQGEAKTFKQVVHN